MNKFKRELSALFALASTDLKKYTRKKVRFLINAGLPIMLIWVVGEGVQLNLGQFVDFHYAFFVYTGVIAQTLFQTTSLGVMYLIEDRTSGISQEIFVAPISRYTIVLSKILGQTLIALMLLVIILAFGYLMGYTIPFEQLLLLIPTSLFICLLGGSFGLLAFSNLKDMSTAHQVSTILIGSQFFLAGIFNPIQNLPPVLFVISRISPLTYAVDLVRGIVYWGSAEYSKVVLHDPWFNLGILVSMCFVFFIIGTYIFTRAEKSN